MNNPKVLKAISAIAFVISALFTIKLFISSSNGLFAVLLSASMAVVLEVAKVGFFTEGLSNRQHNPIIRGILMVISVALVISSMFASSAYVQNEAAKTRNKEIQTSTAYKQADESRNLQKDLYLTKKSEISSLESDKEKTIAQMIAQRDSYPKNYYTVKENITREIAKKTAEFNAKIDSKSNDLTKISSTLSVPIDTSKLNVNESKGYTGIFKLVAGIVSNEDGPVDPYQLELYFFIILGVLFEGVAVLSYYLAKTKEQDLSPILSNNEPQKIIINRPTRKNLAVAQKKIGFTQEPAQNQIKGIKQEDLKQYIDYMFQSAESKDGKLISRGYKHIAQAIGMGESARKIYNYLERSNVLCVDGKRTVINKSKDDILSAI